MQKLIKKYWPVLLLLLAVGYVIYIRRKTDKTVPAATGNTEPVSWGADPTPANGITVGEVVGTTPGNTGNPNTGGMYLPDYIPPATGPAVISDPLPWMTNQDTIQATGNAATINFV